MFHIERYKRFWALYLDEELICVTVYRKGAKAVQLLLEKHGVGT